MVRDSFPRMRTNCFASARTLLRLVVCSLRLGHDSCFGCATRRQRSCFQASAYRNRCGSVNTHCRTGTSGRTWSTRCAARSAIRHPPQLGQKPRPCMRTPRVARSCSPHNGTARSRWRGSRSARTPGTRLRRTAEGHGRRAPGWPRRGSARHARVPTRTRRRHSDRAACTRRRARAHRCGLRARVKASEFSVRESDRAAPIAQISHSDERNHLEES